MNVLPTPSTRAVGERHEDRALAHLLAGGMSLVARNARSRFGEIDLVMRDGRTLVFCEVRYRACGGFGGGVGSVDRAKQRRIVATARGWLAENPRDAHAPCRFDVVALERGGEAPLWIKAAFEPEEGLS